jgi:hypothetical protein
MKTLTAVLVVMNMLAAVVQEIEGSQKMFTIQSAEVCLRFQKTDIPEHIVQKLEQELQMRTKSKTLAYVL